MIRIKATLADGTVYVGPIQGNGGRIGSSALHGGVEAAGRAALRSIRTAQRLAAKDCGTRVYEPKPGHAAIYLDETFESAGEPVFIPLDGTTFELEPGAFRGGRR